MLERRSTQTNVPGRCAVLLPVLAALPQPLALLEVGASAGLCLLPDRYGPGPGAGAGATLPGSPMLRCTVSPGTPVPTRHPGIAWRAGLDLNSLDSSDADDRAWLEALVWPGEGDRLAELRAALDTAALDPPPVHRGDLLADLPALAAAAPPGATLVVLHTAVLVYVPDDVRRAFGDAVRATGARWSRRRVAPSPALPHSGRRARPDAPVPRRRSTGVGGSTRDHLGLAERSLKCRHASAVCQLDGV